GSLGTTGLRQDRCQHQPPDDGYVLGRYCNVECGIWAVQHPERMHEDDRHAGKDPERTSAKPDKLSAVDNQGGTCELNENSQASNENRHGKPKCGHLGDRATEMEELGCSTYPERACQQDAGKQIYAARPKKIGNPFWCHGAFSPS